MALGLREECKTSLTQSLAEIISNARVNHCTFLDSDSLSGLVKLDNRLPGGEIRKKLEDYIGETPVSTFVDETIGRDLQETYEYDSDSKGVMLTSFKGYGDPRAVAGRLVQEFDRLPFRYSLSFEFPTAIGEQLRQAIDKEFKLSDTLKIIAPDVQFARRYPLKSGFDLRDKELFHSYWVLENLGDREERSWRQETVCLQAEVSGFVGVYRLTPPLLETIEVLKSFLGLLVVPGIMTIAKSRIARPRVRHLIVHHHVNGKWQVYSTRRLPMDLAEILDALELGSLKDQQGSPKYLEFVIVWLTLISHVFKILDKNADRLRLANQWFLDSHAGDNELLSFVQTMTAMEVLLGGEDNNEAGTGALLRNRCAYLLGTNYDEREQILKEFAEIYVVRSKILHRGKSKLNRHERIMFLKLRDLCSRVILKELELLYKQKKCVTSKMADDPSKAT